MLKCVDLSAQSVTSRVYSSKCDTGAHSSPTICGLFSRSFWPTSCFCCFFFFGADRRSGWHLMGVKVTHDGCPERSGENVKQYTVGTGGRVHLILLRCLCLRAAFLLLIGQMDFFPKP